MPSPEDGGRAATLTRRALLGAAGTSVAGLAGCGRLAGPLGGDEPTDVLRLGLARPPATLDPLARHGPAAALVVRQVVEGLYRYDRELTLQPRLAAAMPEVSRGGRRWVVELAPEARFPGDRPVTAADVSYSVRETRRRGGPAAARWAPLRAVTVVDERTVQFDLSTAHEGFIEALVAPVVPRPAPSEDTGGEPAARTAETAVPLVGSGPFALAERLEDGGVRLRRRPGYWGDQPARLRAVEMPVLADDTKRVVTLRARELGAAHDVPAAVWTTLEGLPDVTVDSVGGYEYVHLGLNCGTGPTRDPQVRRGVARAIDVDTVVAEALGPAGRRTYGPLPRPTAEGWDLPREEWRALGLERDIPLARDLLEGSPAVTPSWEPTVVCPPDDTMETVCEALADGLTAAGYDATVRRLDWPTHRETVRGGDPRAYDVYCAGFLGDPTPDATMWHLLGPAAAGRTEGTYYRGAVAAVTRGREAATRTDRRAAYATAARRALEDVAHIPLYTRNQSVATRAYVEDVRPHPTEGLVLVGEGGNAGVTGRKG